MFYPKSQDPGAKTPYNCCKFLMYFDFDDRYRDIDPVGFAINRRDGVAAAIILHLLFIIAILVAPQYIERFLPVRPVPPPQQQPPKDNPMFVFVQPKADLPP